MRPIKLSIRGINSFIEEQILDFAVAGADNLFGISGCTGSGKTTVLDSIILSLYEKQSERGSVLADYINLKCEDATIKFTFSMDGAVYETERFISRKTNKNYNVLKRNGEVIAEGGKAYELLLEKIGLDVNEFTNVVVLQQGRFSKFLKSTTKERTKIISKLFGLDRFEGLFTKFNEKAKVLSTEIKTSEEHISLYAGVTEEVIIAKGKEMEQNSKALVVAEKEKEEADKSATTLARGREKYLEFDKNKKEIEKLNGEIDVISERIKKGEFYKKELLERETALVSKEKSRDGLVARRTVLESLDEEYLRVCEKERKLTEQKSALEGEQKRLATEKEALDRSIASLDFAQKNCASLAKNSFIEGFALESADEQKCSDYITLWTAKQVEKNTLLSVENSAREEREKRQEEFKKATEIALKFNKMIKDAEAEAENKKIAYDETKRRYDEAIKNNALFVVTSGLKEGDTCPICGGKVKKGEVCVNHETEIAEKEFRLAEEQKNASERSLAESKSAHSVKLSEVESARRALLDAESKYAEAKDKSGTLDGEVITQTLNALNAFKKALVEAKDEEIKVKSLTDKVKILKETYESNLALHKTSVSDLEKEKIDLDKKAGKDFKEELTAVKKALEDLDVERKKLDGDKMKSEGLLLQLTSQLTSSIAQRDTLASSLSGCIEVTEEQLEKAKLQAKECDDMVKNLIKEVEKAKSDLASLGRDYAIKKELEERINRAKKERDRFETMTKLFRGEAFSEFVVGEYIKDFTARATEILSSLTGGKYSLYYDENKGEFSVADFLAGNEKRSVKTLSGGETFLASLSLAIAISKELSMNKNYDFFFIDEGFGTLSADALDTVTSALENLSKGTLVGVITHRGELIERLPFVVKVEQADEVRGSKISY